VKANRLRSRFGLATILALCVGAGACAEEREPINRVQPDALAKEFFVGADLANPTDDPEFYWRNYVVDGSTSQSLIGIGSWGGVDRIRWEITEDLLIAHKAYQWMEGADDRGKKGELPDGTIVAAYRVLSHFDIRRAYNPSTGEEMNVIEENSSDLPWYARKYMRIDWSQNIVDTPVWDDMFIGKMFGDIRLSPVAYAVTDPNHPDAPHFEAEAGYFDITNKYLIEPEDSWYAPGLPACIIVGFFTGSATYECDPQEAVVRSSYLRIDPAHDFEPLEITNAPLDVVGNPAGIDVHGGWVGLAPPGIQGWDPGYGFTDALHHRYAHIHNVWQKSHQEVACESDDDLDADGTADACAASITGYTGNLGSQCDVAVGKCTIPLRDRQVRTSGYWVNVEMPAELQDPVDAAGQPAARGAAEEIIGSWNQLMTNAVATAREVECRRTGGDRDTCHGELFAPDQQMVGYGAWLTNKSIDETPVLTLCHNPVRAYDVHEVCGETGAVARLGDIRKNFMAYWPYASRVRWGGIGNWGADPLTGEIRGGAAMIMGRSATMAAALQRDIIQLALGDITIDEVIEGVPADRYAHYLQEGHTPEALPESELEHRASSVDAEHARLTIGAAPLPGATVAEKLGAWVQAEKSTTYDVDAIAGTKAEFEAVAGALRGTLAEAELVDGQWMTDVAGMDPELTSTEDAMDAVSPLRGMDPGQLASIRETVGHMMEMKGVCFGDNEAPTLGSIEMQGLAKWFDQKYPIGEYTVEERGELIYRDLWIEAFKGIAIHEVGHSLGLLHNWASSWDSPNYNPQYWQLRTHDGTSTASCDGVPRTGDPENDTCMGPRYLDPETADEMGDDGEPRPNIDYFANTSVMEYQLERFMETVGLGSYDQHAMKALYGRVIETFDDADRGGFSLPDQMTFAPRMESQLSEQDRVTRSDGPFQGQTFPKPTHYTELARKMKVFDAARCRDATDDERAEAGWRLVHGKVCAGPPRDHAAWKDLEHGQVWDQWADSFAPYLRAKAGTKTGEGKVRWFYRYGTSINSYFHTGAFDAGADPYEVTMSAIGHFDAVYPWRYFRRQNREFFAEGLPFAASRGFFEQMRAYHWNAANRNAFYRGFGQSTFDVIAGSDDWHRPVVVAETEMFNALARAVLTPEPGDYAPLAMQPVDTTRSIFDAVNGTSPSFRIGIVDGRFIGDEFDSDPEAGGSWNYLHWMRHAGFGVEKIYAAMALADGRPVLATISRANYLDGRATKINFRNDMPQAVDRLLGGLVSEDWETVGMYVDPGTELPQPKMLPLAQVDVEPGRPQGALVMYPNVGYKQQLGVLLFAHVYSRINGDQQLSNKLRLWIDGQQGEVNIPPEQQVRFSDPTSGYTYVARTYGHDVLDQKEIDAGIAARMVEHANALLVSAYQVQTDGNGDPVLDSFGSPVLVLDSDAQPIVTDEERSFELGRYVALMDAARQIAHTIGFGPL
jgi:hypothetical protein